MEVTNYARRIYRKVNGRWAPLHSEGVINKLKIDKGSRLRVTIKLEGKAQKEKILSYAGLLSELTEEEEKRFDESIKRRGFFSERNVEI